MARRVAWTESAWRELESAANFIARFWSTPQPLSGKPNPQHARSKTPRIGDVWYRVGDPRFVVVSRESPFDLQVRGRVIVMAFIHGHASFAFE